MTFKPSTYQEAIFDFIANDDRNLIVSALAGTGKTTTACEALTYIPEEAKAIFVCFNKSIQKELAGRLPHGVEGKTLHSLGMGCIMRGAGVGYKELEVDANVTTGIAVEVVKDLLSNGNIKHGGWTRDKKWIGPVKRLVGLAKNTLAKSEEDLDALADVHRIVDSDPKHSGIPIEELVTVAMSVLDVAVNNAENRRIDFDDMIWLPVVHNWKPKHYDVTFVDEAQDINEAQLWFLKQLTRPVKGRTSRMVAIGDDAQSIYHFRGAGAGVLQMLKEEFAAEQMPLPRTYRCGQAIVDVAKQIVPEFEADPSTGEGRVRECEPHEMDPRAGDFVLSRTNAPLVGTCFRLLKQNIPATIAGRNIGLALIALIKTSKAQTTRQLLDWLDKRDARIKKKYGEEDPRRVEEEKDQSACIRLFTEDAPTVTQVTTNINRMFSDPETDRAVDPRRMVVCSSVHRAKGLERDRVWLLLDTFRHEKPFPRSTPEQKQEERNIFYVAITRAAKELVLVSDEVDEGGEV